MRVEMYVFSGNDFRAKCLLRVAIVYSWIGRPIRADKNQFTNEPEGLRHFRDHRWKALGEENSILSGPFLFRHYFESYTE